MWCVLAQWPVHHCPLTLFTPPNSQSTGGTTPQLKARIQLPVSEKAVLEATKVSRTKTCFAVPGWSRALRDRGKAKLLPIGDLIQDIPPGLPFHWPAQLSLSPIALEKGASDFNLSSPWCCLCQALPFLAREPSIWLPAWAFSSWFVGMVNNR